MRGNLDFRTIFPIKDAPSAHLMLRKAEYLYQAGVIDRAEKQVVAALFCRFHYAARALRLDEGPECLPVRKEQR